ncbi:uncharacterized protein GIQ15_06807 [Arthroderma uncinatum]|uniref:uncharacterized protein n=1 Tax=Arthroderma uncinatum TaxID=74035 RepID=UPI00144AA9D5|nr:uncharacterized protein GIQ15_06807 [Arthroderma uncinatum]KAF3479831.1 hypothetical protein GIQ15_06807 [Arthroderma uncinatum]
MAGTKKEKTAEAGKSAAKTAKDGPNPSKTLCRPPTRNIVRWNDDLDRKLLLSIQSACNRLGVRVPWTEVANLMQNGITDGAIVQHLAKLRIRMVNAGLDVPPPLRRGGATSPLKSAAATDTPETSATVASGKGNARKKATKRSSYDSGDESFDEGKKPNKKAKTSKGKSNAGKTKRKPKRTAPKSDDDTEDSGVDGFEVTSDTESVNEPVDQEYVATGEDFASFRYDRSRGASSTSELSKPNEPEASQKPSDGVNPSYPIHHANVNEAAMQGIPGVGEPITGIGEIQTMQFGNEIPTNNQQGFAIGIDQAISTDNQQGFALGIDQAIPTNNQQGFALGIDQAIPPTFTPQVEMDNIAGPSSWTGNPMAGEQYQVPQQFPEVNSFDFINDGMDHHAPFVPDLPPHPFPNQFGLDHNSQLPFIEMDSVDPVTLLAFAMQEDEDQTQAEPSNQAFDWSFESEVPPTAPNEEECFDDLMQQLTTV